ncbi:TPA: hypothetical protein N0F65_008071 [Lagenidium giganteum]|uniref:G-protein coupled receptors family 3 profile domain-containing protein n=1 Tax=Lagenidium giganteum TaxID=4803 RepID=A0AAV2YR90_9STRA|nr:TPA: hypothetical protein N0F65_008071 [Lagenidium giganteum]
MPARVTQRGLRIHCRGCRHVPSHARVFSVISVFLCWLSSSCSGVPLAPNQLLGTCLTDEWVARIETELGVSATARDARGQLVHPFLRRALQTTRFQFNDDRTNSSDLIYQPDCVPDGAAVYGVGSRLDADGHVVNVGRLNGSVIVELNGWASHSLTSMVFAILAAEVYGYDVAMYAYTDTKTLTQRMSSVRSGKCTPTHVNLEVWGTSIQADLQVYANETYTAGGTGYFGRSGLYTTTEFIRDGLNTTKNSPSFSADFWRDYRRSKGLISQLPVSRLLNDSHFFPPTEIACGKSFGCKDYCSKSAACTAREASGKECLVVVMMYDYYDPGYLQATLENNGVPAYFCFLGYDGAQSYVVAAQAKRDPVAFYHYEPDPFHFQHPGVFDRVFLPQADPVAVMRATGTFGDRGYGNKSSNPVSVDFPTTELVKYASNVVQDNQPLAGLVSQLSISSMHVNQLLRLYVNASAASTTEDPFFEAACSWVRDNFEEWEPWLGRLPTCTFFKHVQYTLGQCNDTNNSVRTITFAWQQPDPRNKSIAYNCDGGLRLPTTLQTSRSCDWLATNTRTWSLWLETLPSCDGSFYTYTVDACDANAKRQVTFQWMIPDPANASLSLECVGGVALPKPVTLDCDFTPTSSSPFIGVTVVSALQMALIVGAMGWVYYRREQPIVKRSQFEFLELMLLGGLQLCIATVFYGGSPSSVRCALRPVLLSTGFTLLFGSLVVKSIRVYRVFLSGAMKRVVVTTKDMYKILNVMLLVDALVIAAWYIVDFPGPALTNEQLVVLNGGTVTNASCLSYSIIFSVLLIFWKAILLAMGIFFSFKIRKVPSDFQESFWIFSAAVVVLFGSVLVLPLAYMVEMPATQFYAIFASSVLGCSALVIGFMLVPKVMRLNEQAVESRKARTTTSEMPSETSMPRSNPSEDGRLKHNKVMAYESDKSSRGTRVIRVTPAKAAASRSAVSARSTASGGV